MMSCCPRSDSSAAASVEYPVLVFLIGLSPNFSLRVSRADSEYVYGWFRFKAPFGGVAPLDEKLCMTITVNGAARIFGRFVSIASDANCDFFSGLRTQMNRAGQLLAEVGPHFSRS